MGWEQIGRILDGEEETPEEQLILFEEEPAAQAPLWANVNLRSIQVKRLRQFGKPYLAMALWRRLQLHRFFEEHLPLSGNCSNKNTGTKYMRGWR